MLFPTPLFGQKKVSEWNNVRFGEQEEKELQNLLKSF